MQDVDPAEAPDELFDRIRQEMDEAFARMRRPIEIAGVPVRPPSAAEPEGPKAPPREEAA